MPSTDKSKEQSLTCIFTIAFKDVKKVSVVVGPGGNVRGRGGIVHAADDGRMTRTHKIELWIALFAGLLLAGGIVVLIRWQRPITIR